MPKKRIIFRIAPFNRLSFPVLLNAWESAQIDRHFEIIIRETPLTSPPSQDIRKDDVVLFSFMTPHIPQIHEEIIALKETGAIIAGGGPHISGEQDLSLKMGFNILFIGPGETNFLSFATDLLENKLEKNKIYPYPSLNQNISDLDTYVPITKHMKGIPPLEIMRGCAWNCRYCTTGLRSPIYRNLDSINNFLNLTSTTKVLRINFICPSSLEYQAQKDGRHQKSLEKIDEILRLTHSYRFRFIEYGIFPSEIRPDTISVDALKILKKYVSHKYITLGAQSGSDLRLKELKRGHTTGDIEQAVGIINDCGFLVYLDFIVGYPGETTGERQITIQFIKNLHRKYRVRTQLHYFFPLSGSDYAFRFPSFLSETEKNTLHELHENGISRAGWIENEKQVITYFDWLKQNFPGYYSKYSLV
ncbi:MAG: TIGR04013 family B12-binding domain/radical SAM domain-containing protein [Acidobacteria bacterium]|nr:TIGR04013 family B12-binding domain/radical SAM domain-containing protein [Acidobacteriota bacterium]